MTRWTRIALRALGRAARPYLHTHGLLQTVEPFHASALVWQPGAGRVLVLAPHMDDETIGCGGTLALHARRGADLHAVFLTDGRWGGPHTETLRGAERAAAALALTATRKREALMALDTLGVHQVHFLDAEDGQLAPTPDRVAQLTEHLDRIRPEIVYLPWFLEAHPDHAVVTELLLQATRRATSTFRCHAYEVWTPLFPNCFVAIDETIEQKRTALRAYASQLAAADYLHSALGLAAYRSCAFASRTARFAEAFLALPASDYLTLYRAHGQRRAR